MDYKDGCSFDIKSMLFDYELCLEEDSFLDEKCIWIAKLSNGVSVYQDDDRPNIEISSAWKRLKKYLKDNDHICIEKINVKFRSHTEEILSKEGIYYYSCGFMCSAVEGFRSHFHVFGKKINDLQVECIWYKAPEITKFDSKVKNIIECNKESLIYNNI